VRSKNSKYALYLRRFKNAPITDIFFIMLRDVRINGRVVVELG